MTDGAHTMRLDRVPPAELADASGPLQTETSMRSYALVATFAFLGALVASAVVRTPRSDVIRADHERLVADPAWAVRTPGVGRPAPPELKAEDVTRGQRPARSSRASTALFDTTFEEALPTNVTSELPTTLRAPLELEDPWTHERYVLASRPRAQLDRANPWTGRNDL